MIFFLLQAVCSGLLFHLLPIPSRCAQARELNTKRLLTPLLWPCFWEETFQGSAMGSPWNVQKRGRWVNQCFCFFRSKCSQLIAVLFFLSRSGNAHFSPPRRSMSSHTQRLPNVGSLSPATRCHSRLESYKWISLFFDCTDNGFHLFFFLWVMKVYGSFFKGHIQGWQTWSQVFPWSRNKARNLFFQISLDCPVPHQLLINLTTLESPLINYPTL